MPTGYTAGIADGSMTTFREYAMTCARAFGALIDMRDKPTGAEIPEAFEPKTSYNEERLAKAKRELADAEALTAVECAAWAEATYEDALKRRRERLAQEAEQRARYERMVDQALAWEPPSPDHAELQNFMVSQLQESIRFDCPADNAKRNPMPERLSGAEWKREELKRLRWDVSYHEDAIEKERERTAGRNKWLRELRASLEA